MFCGYFGALVFGAVWIFCKIFLGPLKVFCTIFLRTVQIFFKIFFRTVQIFCNIFLRTVQIFARYFSVLYRYFARYFSVLYRYFARYFSVLYRDFARYFTVLHGYLIPQASVFSQYFGTTVLHVSRIFRHYKLDTKMTFVQNFLQCCTNISAEQTSVLARMIFFCEIRNDNYT